MAYRMRYFVIVERSAVPLHLQSFLYTFSVAFCVAVTGEDRNFQFGTEVDHNKRTDDKIIIPKGGMVGLT